MKETCFHRTQRKLLFNLKAFVTSHSVFCDTTTITTNFKQTGEIRQQKTPKDGVRLQAVFALRLPLPPLAKSILNSPSLINFTRFFFISTAATKQSIFPSLAC